MNRDEKRVSRGALWLAALVLLCGATAAALTGAGGKAVAALASAYDVIAPTNATFSRTATSTVEAPPAPEVAHIPTPESVKAIYMTQCVVGTPSFRDQLVELLDTTELNAVVIDIRDFSGGIAFPTNNPVLTDMVSKKCGAADMKAFIKRLHEKKIYVIGRITVFQNPVYTSMHPDQAVQKKGGGVWKDHKGLAFVDVGATPYWSTVVELSKESYAIGFDELNFDYIRYPSDGDMATADYIKRDGKTKQQMLEDFFKYLHDNVQPIGVVMSADLFGMTTTNHDDLNIGQVLERTMPYFDYIAPMVYPSHYPPSFNG
ncbi:MAG TPA: putative glycoside hydrolase, partial [Pyrinomonadaceae bacterium]|nr:putative glycoside hydrolase [Pyrinomonadaceae bacterium]